MSQFTSFLAGTRWRNRVKSRKGVLAQLVERLNGIEEVRGSNPLGSTISWWSLRSKDSNCAAANSTTRAIARSLGEA